MPKNKNPFNDLVIHWKSDLLSGFLVFLLALPLSLGIAKASGFPASMGILTAILGGFTSLFFKVAPFTIKGPAAGLITVCAGAIYEFGGGIEAIQICGTAILLSALFQIVFAYLKFGDLSDFFPHAAVQGMLSTIGIIIIAKQIPVLLGVNPEIYNMESPLVMLGKIPSYLQAAHLQISLIGLLSLFILIFYPKIKSSILQKIPSPVVILLLTIPLSLLLNFKQHSPEYALVEIGDFWNTIQFSINFSLIKEWVFWKYVIMFLFINSLESLLTVKAIDNISPHKHPSNYNADLYGVGVGNFISGILGALPMISEVVRSSANITFGAKSKWSNFFHGLFLLLSIVLFVPVIEYIPNAALAAMLIFAGYRLSAPKHFKQIYTVGKEQFLIFIATIIITLLSDLLTGIFAGIVINFVVHLINGANFKKLFKADFTYEERADVNYIVIRNNAIFANVIQFKKLLDGIQNNKDIEIDCRLVRIIDHSFMAFIINFEKNDLKNRKLHIRGKEKLNPLSSHPLATRVR